MFESTHNRKALHALAMIAGLGLATASQAATLYVDDDAAPGGDGSSWSNAFVNLQDALAEADAASNVTQIRVAQGVYTPDRSASSPNGSGDQDAAFVLLDGVSIKGGYAGLGASNPHARNIDQYQSILSGDLLQNDNPDWFFNHYDNAYHVVIASDTASSAVLDGFYVQSGYSDGGGLLTEGAGGGVYNDGGHATIRNCTFRYHHKSGMGGAIFNRFGAEPTISNCTFIGNAGNGGGAIANMSSIALISDCRFIDNVTTFAGNGGAIFNTFGSSASVIRDCEFVGNQSTNGGAVGNGLGAEPTLINCWFSENHAFQAGGAVYSSEAANPTLINCTLANNSCVTKGGAIMNAEGNPTTIINCTIVGNSAGNGAGGIHSSGTTTNPVVANTIVWGNSGAEVSDSNGANTYVQSTIVQGGWNGNGVDNDFGNPQFMDASNGDYHLSPGSPAIDAGNSNAIPSNINTDLDGNPRIVNDPDSPDSGIDLGAYEFQAESVDITDCNGNGVDDADDIDSGEASDCNGNGIPDSCDFDSGDADDCNGNGIPDGCDFDSGAANDCDGNGVPDSCDIDNGSSDDFNNDGVPDSCSGCLADVNGDGLIDVLDLIEIVITFGTCEPECAGDLNNDGFVTIEDLTFAVQNWGDC